MLRFDQFIRASSLAAALVAATFLGMPARAQTPAAIKPAVSAPKKVVSPYARAASQREHAGQAPLGHAPTMVQGMGRPRKPHAGTPSK
jgi:hypothetical protein